MGYRPDPVDSGVQHAMKILVACEFSGVVRDAFNKRGHEALSCDLLPTDVPGWHYQGDVFDIINYGWDMMIAHPPCTYLSNAGVRWLYEKENRWCDLIDGAVFFRKLLNAPIDRICVENPVMHKWANKIINIDYAQMIQPWQFGHGETKATCLWLKGLRELQPTDIVDEREHRIHKMPPGPDRWKLRSTTYQGIADAMAEQWGSNALN